MISFELRKSGTDLAAFFGQLPERVRAAIKAELVDQTDLLESTVIGKLSGEVLRPVTGALRGQVHHKIDDPGGAVMTGSVFMDGDLTVPLVHEYGGRGFYEILPVRARVLHFFHGGQEVFARRVNHPPLPERSYLRSSLAERRPAIEQGFRSALAKALGVASV